ncbi:decarboxylating 6-phosphogluconate dehydrogenase [Candidatus Woesearchaeota archaeon]|nr:decarboxylating 6-phosphogluconate dehydrogenase [Candidatus Woesearchaeota archaeon]
MKIGFIGLGRMGYNMVLNLLDNKQEVVAYNRSPEPVKKIAKYGAIPVYSLEELTKQLPKRKVIWIMVTSSAVDQIIKELLPLLSKQDIIIDGGNSFYKDSIRRYNFLKKKGIHFLDVGTSGGIEGARRNGCLMIGGDKVIFNYIEQIFKAIAQKEGYGYMGSTGSGHFVKMVHNGIEYGMVAAIDEGFEALKKYKDKFNIDLKEVSKVYAHGSIIDGKLTKWLYQSFTTKDYLKNISCVVPKGETEDEMKELTKLADMQILKESIKLREKSRNGLICAQMIAAMRNLWGGHKVNKK